MSGTLSIILAVSCNSEANYFVLELRAWLGQMDGQTENGRLPWEGRVIQRTIEPHTKFLLHFSNYATTLYLRLSPLRKCLRWKHSSSCCRFLSDVGWITFYTHNASRQGLWPSSRARLWLYIHVTCRPTFTLLTYSNVCLGLARGLLSACSRMMTAWQDNNGWSVCADALLGWKYKIDRLTVT